MPLRKFPKIPIRRMLPWLLIFHPRGPFKRFGPWIAVMLIVAALPFLLMPKARDRLIDTITTQTSQPGGTNTASNRPQGQGGTGGNVPTNFDPLNQSGVWAIGTPDAARGEWSWERAKRLAADVWEAQVPGEGSYQSFYCGCTINRTGPSSGEVDLPSCGYETLGDMNRARRMEWEHIVPASTFGNNRACWTQGLPACRKDDGTMEAGRSCCERADPVYQMMSNDPVNLAPSIGEVNGRRSNLPFGLLPPGVGDDFGQQCGMRIESSMNTVEPPASRRGDIARVYAYMSRAYGITLPQADANLYTRWMEEDPISAEEITINQAIGAQGHRPNPFVLNPR